MSDIDYSKLRSLTAKRIINALIKDGFYLDRTSGFIINFSIQSKEE